MLSSYLKKIYFIFLNNMIKYICLLCNKSRKYSDSSSVRKHAKSKHNKELREADRKKIKIFKKISDDSELENLIKNDTFLNELFPFYDQLYKEDEYNKDHDYLFKSVQGLSIKLRGEPKLVSNIDLSI